MNGAQRRHSAHIAWAATTACLLEASAEKPGNVSPTYDFRDTTYVDFLLSAAAVGPVLGEAASLSVGELVRQSVLATRRVARANTNLGIILLLAPLAKAYAAAEPGKPPGSDADLRSGVAAVLARLDREDAAAAYEGIRLANPGGLGEAAHDVANPPQVSFREAMRSAAARDSIGGEYATDFALTFSTGLPALREALWEGQEPRTAVLSCFLTLLGSVPDSLIGRKLGAEAARRVMAQAAEIRRLGGVRSSEGRAATLALTRRLRDPENRYNPGTTADLTAAALFSLLLVEGPSVLRGGRA